MASLLTTATAPSTTATTHPHEYVHHPSVSVTHIQNCGKGMRATTTIPSGTVLFTEQAVAFHRANVHLDALVCDRCGQWLLSEQEQLRYAWAQSPQPQPPSSPPTELLDVLASTTPNNSVPCGHSGCQARWCSDTCKQRSRDDGHQYLCQPLSPTGKLYQFLVHHAQDNSAYPTAAHFGCAARVLAKVAKRCATAAPVATDTTLVWKRDDLLAHMHAMMGSFYQTHFTASLHAIRTCSEVSVLDSENVMFVEHIQPAYRSAYLGKGLSVLQAVFEPLGVTFADTLLTLPSLDALMGIFATNNFAVEFTSPVERLLLQHYKNGGGGNQVSGFPRIKGTACFKHFALLNHSCVKNTQVEYGGGSDGGGGGSDGGGGALTISVATNKCIEKDEEIYNCYTSCTGVKEREVDLYQYMFKCNCELCVVQRLERKKNGGESSSGEDY